MIIERQYVPFGVLFNRDKEAWSIFVKAFEESYPRGQRQNYGNVFASMFISKGYGMVLS